jgi:hypothetical protein
MATALSIIAIAVSGLTLVWTIVWSIYTYRRTTLAQVTVTSGLSIPMYGPTPETMAPGDTAIAITATNTGAVTVTLSGAQLRIKGREGTVVPIEWVVQTPQDLPIVLQPGLHWYGMIDIASVVGTLARQYGTQSDDWKVKPFVRDSAGRTYEVEGWINIGK